MDSGVKIIFAALSLIIKYENPIFVFGIKVNESSLPNQCTVGGCISCADAWVSHLQLARITLNDYLNLF